MVGVAPTASCKRKSTMGRQDNVVSMELPSNRRVWRWGPRARHAQPWWTTEIVVAPSHPSSQATGALWVRVTTKIETSRTYPKKKDPSGYPKYPSSDRPYPKTPTQTLSRCPSSATTFRPSTPRPSTPTRPRARNSACAVAAAPTTSPKVASPSARSARSLARAFGAVCEVVDLKGPLRGEEAEELRGHEARARPSARGVQEGVGRRPPAHRQASRHPPKWQ